MNKQFQLWWLFFCLQIAGASTAWYFGFFETLWHVDQSFIGLGILAMYSIATLWVGNKTRKIGYEEFDTSNGYFLCESFLKLGMIGTVVGFIWALGPAFETLNLNDPASAKKLMVTMGVGMGTALWTTLVGLICNQLLKMQLVNYESDPTDGGWLV